MIVQSTSKDTTWRTGRRPSASRRELETSKGSELPIFTDGGIHVGDANVVSADIEAGNGLIHVIDSVLLPAAA